MKRFLCAIPLFLLALPARANEETLDSLWATSVLWEVGDNVEKVPAARTKLVARGAETLDYLIPAKLDTKDGLVQRGLQVIIPGIANGGDATLRDKAIKGLLAAIESDKPNSRRIAADLLGLCGAIEAAPAIAKLLTDKDARGGALSALGVLKVQTAVPALIAAMKDKGASERFRITAVGTLGAIGGADAQTALLEFLLDPAAPIRFAAQYALEAMRSIGALRGVLASNDKKARLHAISALSRLGAREARGDLRALLTDKDAIVRGFAVEALSSLWLPADEAWIRAMQKDETDPFVTGKLEAAMKKILNPPKPGEEVR